MSERSELVEKFEKIKERKRIGNFKVDREERLFLIKETEKATTETLVSRNTPFVTRQLRDIEDGSVYFTIKFKHRGKDVYKNVKASTLVTRRDLLPLSDDGLAVTENNARHLIDFINYYLDEHNDIPEEDMTTRIGYIGNKFIHPQDKNINIIQSGGYQALIDGFQPKGDLKDYIKHVFNHINKEHTALFFMLTALASPLLKKHDIDPFIVDLSGRTSTGKTTLLELCSSVWGNKELVGEWNITKVALERKAVFLNNFPLMLDDTRKANKFTLEDSVYNFSSGRSKGRGNKTDIDEEFTYHNVLISTGEVAITEYGEEKGGAAARIISISNAPFKDTNNFKTLYDGMAKYYGTLGLEFMKVYHKNRTYYDNLFETYENWYFDQSEGNDVIKRLGRNYAIIHTAGEILLDIPGVEFDLDEVMNENYKAVSSGENSSYDKPKELLFKLLEKIDGKRNNLKHNDDDDDHRAETLAISKQDELCIPVYVINEFLEKESTQTRKMWLERGFTEINGQGKDNHRVRYQSQSPNCLKIPRGIYSSFGFEFLKS